MAPENDEVQSSSSEQVTTAVNELSIQDPTARASLRGDENEINDEVVPQEEKKKIVPVLNTNVLDTVHSDSSDFSPPAIKSKAIHQNAPLKLNQLYFDNRKVYSENTAADLLFKLAKASYSAKDSHQALEPLKTDTFPNYSKLENLLGRTNQSITGGIVPSYAIPAVLIVIGSIIGVAAIGYNFELNRIGAAEKTGKHSGNRMKFGDK